MNPGYWEGAERYLRWTGAVKEAAPLELFDPGPPGTELEWQSWWFGGSFGREFTSTRGHPVRVIQFGHWNRGAGPDFTEAAVEIDGTLRRGCIELDRTARDWERHGHGENPSFCGVVLHVHGPAEGGETFFTRTLEHREVTQVELSREMFRPGMGGDGRLPEARLGRCAPALGRISQAAMEELLRCAAQRRLQAKARRIALAAAAHGMEQAHYQGFAEALGYRSNQLAMRVLAQRLPLAEARSFPVVTREAWLFGFAGFLQADLFEAGDRQTREYLKNLWDEWWKARAEWSGSRDVPWCFSGVRPVNHPQRRVAALAAWVGRWDDWAPLLPGTSPRMPGDWKERLLQGVSGLQHPYWDRHYTLISQRSASRMALVGRDRVADWLGNWLFPLAVEQNPREWENYERLAGGKENEKLRRAKLRLFGEGAETFGRSYWQQQGLLQVYEDFCLRDATDCAGCPMPEQSAQWC